MIVDKFKYALVNSMAVFIFFLFYTGNTLFQQKN